MDYPKKISEIEYKKFRKIIKNEIGLNLTSQKKSMLYSRLLKRIKELKINTFEEYYNYIINNKEELLKMFERVTTHKTDFFREKEHFKFLNKKLSEIIKKNLKENKKKISIWSAACSSGEEAYSIAMELEKFPILINWKVKVIASDISNKELESTYEGIYKKEKIKKIPRKYQRIFFREMKDGRYKAKENLKKIVKVKRINLISDKYPFNGKFEIIF